MWAQEGNVDYTEISMGLGTCEEERVPYYCKVMELCEGGRTAGMRPSGKLLCSLVSV